MKTNFEWLRANLDLLEEHREHTTMRMASYHQMMARYYNAQVKAKEFKVGDLVLRQANVLQLAKQGKLLLNWEGPCRVDGVVHLGTYRPKHLDETPLPRPWNSSNLCMYYR